MEYMVENQYLKFIFISKKINKILIVIIFSKINKINLIHILKFSLPDKKNDTLNKRNSIFN